MARPIKDTPILTGSDAERFERIMRDNENRTVPKADYDRAKATYERIRANSPNFPF